MVPTMVVTVTENVVSSFITENETIWMLKQSNVLLLLCAFSMVGWRTTAQSDPIFCILENKLGTSFEVKSHTLIHLCL